MLAATGILHILTRSHQIFITDHAKKLHRQVHPIFSYTGHLQTRENQRRWQTTAINVRFMMMALATVWHCYLHTKVRKRLSITKQRCMGRCSNWQVMQLSRRLPLTITVAAQHVSTTPKTRFNLPKVSVTHSSKQLASFFFTQWRCLGGCTRWKVRFVYRQVCRPLPCKWSADTVAALWHGDSARSRTSSAPLSGIIPGRTTEPETAAKVWTYPDEEQGIPLKHITTTTTKFTLHQFQNLGCLTR